MSAEAKKDEAIKAIDNLFSDTSVDQSTTLELLEEVVEHARENINAIKATLNEDLEGF